MKFNRRNFLFIFYVLFGLLLQWMGYTGAVDSFWGGVGTSLMLVGILRAVRLYRVSSDEAYREQVEISVADERNRFLKTKAWSWAGYMFTLVAACATIGLKILGQDLLSLAAGYSVCLLILLYWGSYLVLQKKY